MRENDKQSFQRTLFASQRVWDLVLSRTREYIASAKCARYGVLFTHRVVVACGRNLVSEIFQKKSNNSALTSLAILWMTNLDRPGMQQVSPCLMCADRLNLSWRGRFVMLLELLPLALSSFNCFIPRKFATASE